jgi:hypothetical protein
VEQKSSDASFKLNYLLPELILKLNTVERNIRLNKNLPETEKNLLILKNEITGLGENLNISDLSFVSHLNTNEFNLANANRVQNFIEYAKRYYSKELDNSVEEKDEILRKLKNKIGGNDALIKLKEEYHNASLENLLLSRLEPVKIEEYKDHLIRNDEPVYKQAEMKLGRAHFFTSDKFFFNLRIDTFWFNLIVLVIMSLFFYVLLITEALAKLIEFIDSNLYHNIINKFAVDFKSLVYPIIKNNKSNDKKVGAFY